MKKIFILLCVTLSSLAAMANGVEVNGIYYLLDSDKMIASVTFDFSGENYYFGEIVIPETIIYSKKSYDVTCISVEAFAFCSSLKSITIPNSIKSIEESAFEGCSHLSSITIPNSVMNIGGRAFYWCYSLASIVVAEGNPIYDSRNNCNAIIETVTNTLITGCKNTIIPKSVTNIGNAAFYDCDSLTCINIPTSVKNIEYMAFADCSSLKFIIIPSSVTTIEWSAFSDCVNLTSITCLATEPPSLESDVFYNVPRDIPLYVPASSVSAYQAAAQWNEFDIQPLLVDVDPIASDTTQLSWLPVDSASLYKLRIYSEQIELDTTLLIEADSLNGGIRIPVTLAPNRDKRMPMDDIGSVVVITLEPNSGATKDTPFKVTVSTKSKDKIDVGFDLTVLKGEKTIKQESGSFALNAPISDGLEDIPMSRFGISSGIYDLYGRHYSFSQWNQLPAGIYILRDGEKASRVMKR